MGCTQKNRCFLCPIKYRRLASAFLEGVNSLQPNTSAAVLSLSAFAHIIGFFAFCKVCSVFSNSEMIKLRKCFISKFDEITDQIDTIIAIHFTDKLFLFFVILCFSDPFSIFCVFYSDIWTRNVCVNT